LQNFTPLAYGTGRRGNDHRPTQGLAVKGEIQKENGGKRVAYRIDPPEKGKKGEPMPFLAEQTLSHTEKRTKKKNSGGSTRTKKQKGKKGDPS